MLTAMRYKSFVWPHNPKTYAVQYRRKTAAHQVPQGLYVLQEIGPCARMMTGEGEFFGKGAYETFQALAAVFEEKGSGRLEHPVWKPTQAFFTELELLQQPREDYVAYRFTFEEDAGEEGGMQLLGPRSERAVWHLVSSGQTLWSIAAEYGTDTARILKLNPAIANPNSLAAGQLVRVV